MTHEIGLFRPSSDHLVRRLWQHLALLRPSHWCKSLIAIPIGPALMIGDATGPALLALAGTITMFSLASAAVYVVNDLSDIDRDRAHPSKRNRPLASGVVTPQAALWMLAGLLAVLVLLALVLPALLTAIVILYLLCNLSYSFWLKHVPIVEMLIVPAGFALRTVSGYVAFGVVPDPWVIATVLSGSLLLTVGKRRDELRRVKTSADHRPVLRHYSEPLLDAYLLVAAVACLGTGLATMIQFFDAVDQRVLFFISLPFAVYLFKRYLLLAFAGTGTGNPTRLLLSDRTIHVAFVFWAVVLGSSALLDSFGTFDGIAALEAAHAAH
ncbi:UbiA prenyltransferase family protein [Roseibium marinum]|uniref:UbiA prenyltransferase family protein n=1 Tax=Roseibium marinum TaxID=281252 RepID=A0A2S3US81_9HYPH|nr:UbiA prenyltransferase family protein [Roseibium marinum]POF30578.1 UbiA prenyltransferase family protein [Roseibium marinum]